MAIGVDSSKWKPRKIKGTPAAYFRNAVAVSILSFGIICGVAFHYSGFTANLRKASEKLYEDPIEQVERKRLIGSGLRLKTGDQLREMMEEESRPDLPYK